MNESENVVPLIRRIRAATMNRRLDVLFVDDSRDTETVDKVALARMTYRSANFDVHIFHRTGEQRWGGLSGAVTDGLRSARSDQIIVMDGDLQHPPEILPDMIAAAEHADIVIASRYCKGGSSDGLDGRIRHLVSRGSTGLAKLFFPLRLRRVSDPMTGYFLVDRTKIDRSRLRPKGFKILLEIIATHPGLRVANVPLQFAERTAGESHGSLKQGLEFFSQLLNLRFGQSVRLFTRLPKFVQFGAIGGSVFALGMAILFALVEIAGWPVLAANAVQLVITFWLNYLLNRHITWRERAISRLAAYKFLVSRAATTLINYILFAWLITLHYSGALFGQTFDFSINYVVANVITLAVIMLLNYEISDRWAFAASTSQTPQDAARLSRRDRRRLQAEQKAVNNTYQTDGLRLAATLAGLLVIAAASSLYFTPQVALPAILVLSSIALLVQSGIEVWRMVYTYRVPEAVDLLRFPVVDKTTADYREHERFCIIVPARHEEGVMASTLLQLAKQTYSKVDIIAVMCDDDTETLRVAYQAATQSPRIEVMEYPLKEGTKPSKPKQLNYVLEQTAGRGYTVVGIVDAEDTVHPELLEHIDVAFRNPEIGIVQGGVQLMNHDSSWYSLHNVLEYYRWFNSAMAFQSDSRFMPLGGNTIFIRDSLLRRAGGWPDTLTEDCSLGVLLSTRYRTQTAVYYEPRLATREETPDTLTSLFKQRVRWNQGFFHEWRRGIWHELPSFKQRTLAAYVLLGPVILAAISLFMLLSIAAMFFLKAPVALVLMLYLPFIPVCLLAVLNAVFLYDFGKAFGRKILLRQYIILFATQLPYQVVLNTAALWSVIRELRGDNSWYKTSHAGNHRGAEMQPAYAVAGVAAMAGAAEGLSND